MSPFLRLPIRRYSQHLTATIPALNRWGYAQWVLSRPLYRFSRFDLKHVAKGQRPQALRIQIRQWSPYANTGHYVVWDHEHALVWAWDADRLLVELAANKLRPGSTRVIPETLLHPVLSSGLRLIACLDGVEGQVWQAQHIVHSRWWAESPGSNDWRSFQRDAGISPDLLVGTPTAQAHPRLQQPWANAADISEGGGYSLPYETWLIRGAILIFAAFTIWPSIELIKTHQVTKQLKTQMVEVTKKADPLLESRRKAGDALAQIESLQAANQYPSQLAILAEVANNLPKNGTYLNEWDFQNGKLKIIVAAPDKLQSSFLVKTLQDSGWFRNVQSGPSSSATTLTATMETLPQREIVLSIKDATGKDVTGPSGTTKMEPAVEPPKSSPRI